MSSPRKSILSKSPSKIIVLVAKPPSVTLLAIFSLLCAKDSLSAPALFFPFVKRTDSLEDSMLRNLFRSGETGVAETSCDISDSANYISDSGNYEPDDGATRTRDTA